LVFLVQLRIASMVREVRTIDISRYDDPEKRKAIAADLFEAARDVGFFYIAGTTMVTARNLCKGFKCLFESARLPPLLLGAPVAGWQQCSSTPTHVMIMGGTQAVCDGFLTQILPLVDSHLFAEHDPFHCLFRQAMAFPEEEIERAFAAGRRFLDFDTKVKTKYPFNPDSYLGHRGPDELETVTGRCVLDRYSACPAAGSAAGS